MTKQEILTLVANGLPFTTLAGTTWNYTTDGPKVKLSGALTANTVITLNNTVDGNNGLIYVVQDSTGGRTLTINGTSIGLNTTALKESLISFINIGGNLFFSVDIANGFAATALATPVLTLTAPSSTEVDASCTTVANAVTYQFETSPDNSTWTVVQNTVATTYNWTGLTASTTYYVRVKAVGNGQAYADSLYASNSQATLSPYNAESVAYFSAVTGGGDTLTTTQKNAVDALVTAMKNASIWTKMKAVYPFVGGTATAHKWNLKNPADTDAAFRIVWTGGVTHSATGVLTNGTTGYGDTKLIPSTGLTVYNTHAAIYNRTTGASHVDLGAQDNTSSGTDHTFNIWLNQAGSQFIDMYDSGTGRITYTAPSPVTGLTIASRTANNSLLVYRAGAQVGSSTTTIATNLPTFSLTLGGRHSTTGLDQFSAREYAFLSIGDGLTTADMTALNTAVVNFETALSRA